MINSLQGTLHVSGSPKQHPPKSCFVVVNDLMSVCHHRLFYRSACCYGNGQQDLSFCLNSFFQLYLRPQQTIIKARRTWLVGYLWSCKPEVWVYRLLNWFLMDGRLHKE